MADENLALLKVEEEARCARYKNVAAGHASLSSLLIFFASYLLLLGACGEKISREGCPEGAGCVFIAPNISQYIQK